MADWLRGCCACANSPKWPGWLTLMGSILINLASGATYSYGNLAPYLVSYLRINGDERNINYEVSIICGGLMWAGQGLGFASAGHAESLFGAKKSTLAGCFFIWTGMLLSAGAIRISFYFLLFTYAVVFGFGAGLAAISPLVTLMKWFPERRGLVSGLVQGSYGVSAFFFNFIQTGFINPHNLSPDRTVNLGLRTETYYSQPSILRRVPLCFFLQAGILFGFHSVGLLLLHDAPLPSSSSSSSSWSSLTSLGEATEMYSLVSADQNVVVEREHDSTDERQYLTASTESANKKRRLITSKGSASEKQRLIKTSNHKQSGFASSSPESSYHLLEHQDKINEDHACATDDGQSRSRYDREDAKWCGESVTLREAIRRASMWQFLSMIGAVALGGVTFSASYKSFGLTFIRDDLYLTAVGSMSAIASFVGHVGGGVLIDYVNIKVVLVSMTGCAAAFLLSVDLTTIGGRYLLPIWVCAMLLLLGTMFALQPVFIMRVYGAASFAGINAVVQIMSMCVFAFLGILAATLLDKYLAWTTLYMIIGALNLAAMIFGLFMKLPHRDHGTQTRTG